MQTSPLDKIATGESNYEKYKDLFTDDKNDVVTMDSFYKLLVAEMSNQDPLEPTSNTEFISQLASFTSLQAQQDNFAMQKQNYANSLIGQIVTVQGKTKEDLVTGTVESVSYGDEVMIKVNDKTYKLSAIKQVHGSAYQSGTTVGGPSQIGDYGAFAAGILGKTVMVQAQDANGETVLDRGVVSSIEIQDGMVRVVVNDYAYNVTDVVQVTDTAVSKTPTDTDEDEETAASAPKTENKAPEKTEQTPAEPAEPEKTEQTEQAPAEPEKTETTPNDTAGTLADRTDESDLTDLVENEQNAVEAAQTAPWVQEPGAQWTEPLISEEEKEDLRGLFGVE